MAHNIAKITALYESLSRDDELQGPSNSILNHLGMLGGNALPPTSSTMWKVFMLAIGSMKPPTMAGDYIIFLNSDAHTVIDEQTYTVNTTVTYGENNQRSTDLIAAVNQFPYAGGDVNFLSRADHFANYEEAVAAPATLSMSERLEAQFINTANFDLNSHVDPNAAIPTTGARNGPILTDLRGTAYDDEAWEPLLDQLTVSDMRELTAIGGYQTVAAPSVGKTQQIDCDGPVSIGFPSAVMIACTWNEDYVSDDSSAPALQAMRWACKDILFTVVNSRAYSPENLNAGMPTWQKVAIGVDVLLGAALAAGAVAVFKKSKKQ